MTGGKLDDIRKRTEGHTEGPWEFDEDNIGSCYGRAYYGIITPSVYTTFGIRAAVTAEDYSPGGGGAREEECKGNAQLISAAPDLLRIATEQKAELAEAVEIIDRLLNGDPVISRFNADAFLARQEAK